jgi:S-adenosylmethionine hydrolase
MTTAYNVDRMMRPIVTLLTDFGTVDGFVGAMKGVVLSRAPEALVLDLTHDIPPQDVHAGARALREAAWTFPAGTIHVAVVDPGVGTRRRRLLLASDGQLFIGPDNGLLSLAAGADARGWVLERRQYFMPRISSTFHGRDVFAAVAGHLAAGIEPAAFGPPAGDFLRLSEPAPRREGKRVIGSVLYGDRFGNLITNIDEGLLGDGEAWVVSLGERSLGPLRETFSDVEPGGWVAYVGSGGRLEIAVREGRAADLAGPQAADAEVVLCAS